MGNFFSDLFGGGGQNYTTTTNSPPVQLPDYAESSAARGTWGDTLKNWSTQPGYGAIQPNWDSIWQNAAGKVHRYFNGGPEGPGLIAGVKSNLAARGMSEQPAAETEISKLGMQEGNQLQDLATQQATQQAQMSEQGRNTWLNSIMQLAGLKPQFVQPSTTGVSNLNSPSGVPGAAGSFLGSQLAPSASGAMDSAGQGLQGFAQQLMQMFGMGGPIGVATAFA